MASSDIRELQERYEALQQGHDQMRAQLTTLTTRLDENTATTNRIEVNTAKIVNAFNAAEGAFTTLDWLAKIGTRLAWLLLPCAIAYGGWQTFKEWITSGGGR